MRTAVRAAGRLGDVDFRSVYDQGFVRVAACTLPVRDRRPGGERRRGARAAARVRATTASTVGAVPGAVPDRLRDRRPAAAGAGAATPPRARSPTWSAASAELPRDLRRRCAAAARQPAAQLRPCVIGGGALLGVAPKSYLPTYREFYERRHFAPGDDRRGATITRGRPARVPFGPDLLFAADDIPGLVVHVEVCEDMWVPVPPSAGGGAGRRHRAARTCRAARSRWPGPRTGELLVRSASARCLAAYAYAAAGQGESSTDLSWDGQTMVYEMRRPARRDRAIPRTGRAAPWSTSTCCGSGRTGCGRARSTTTGAPSTARIDGFRTRAVRRPPARRRPRPAPVGRPVPVRPRRPGTPGAGLLRGLQHPGLRARAATARDRQPEGRHRGVGRSGLHPRADRRGAGRWTCSAGPAADILAFTLPGFATSTGTKDNAHRGCRRPWA